MHMDNYRYKKFHENQMLFNNGTSQEECGLVISVIPICISISIWIYPFIPTSLAPVFEFVVIVLPVILNVTVLSAVNHLVFSVLTFLYLSLYIPRLDLKNLKTLLKKKIEVQENIITNYRACTNFTTAICILAVDFNAFPRRFAKTEEYGFGLMDLGVGFFVFSSAIVDKAQVRGNILKLVNSIGTLIILGLVRLVITKMISYQEHVSEYGTHWNFFFTLALCKFVVYFIKFFTNFTNSLQIAIVIGCLHEFVLSLGLKTWIFSNAPRNSFLSANREGLTSSLGFVCLYFAGKSIGTLFNQNNKLTYSKLLQSLATLAVLSSLSTKFLHKTTGISRRLVNIGYIFWVLSLSLTILLLLLIVEISSKTIRRRRNDLKLFQAAPQLLKSINRNGLFFFLCSNILTGLVNLVFQTFLAHSTQCLIILIIYMAILCMVNYYLYINNIILKI